MNQDSNQPTNVRVRIVLVGILMAFGLYLTRLSIPEIAKSDSFLNDSLIVNASTTRFSVDLKEVTSESELMTFLSSQFGKDVSVIKLPLTVQDSLTKSQADAILTQLEAAGGKGVVRISKQQIGSIMGVFFFTYALLQVPAGWIGDRIGARKALALYILLWSLLTCWSGMVASLTGLLIARLGFGLAQAGAYPTSSSVVRRWFPLTRRGQASSLIAFGGRLGAATAPFLTMFLILHMGGWRPTLLLYGLSGIGIAVMYFFVVRDRPSEHPKCNQAERDFIGLPADDRKVELREVFGMLGVCCRSPSLWLNSMLQFCVNMGWAFLVVWLPSYLKEVQGVPEQQGALMVSIVLAMGMLGQLLGGRIADWSVRSFGLRVGRVLPIAVANFLAGLAYLVCMRLDSAWGVVACCAVVSLMTDVANPSIWAFMQDVGGRNTGSVFGWGNMWGNFGAAAHSKLIPLVLALGNSGGWGYTFVFVTCAASYFIAGSCALGMNATRLLTHREEV